MRRFILVFMMLVLPLQWTWAAAASVCEHESAGAHFGHHDPKHAGTSESASGTSEASPAADLSGSHPDCHTCHGMGAGCIAASSAHGPGWHDSAPLPAYGRYFPEPPIEGLLRPPMTFAA